MLLHKLTESPMMPQWYTNANERENTPIEYIKGLKSA